MTSNSLKLEAWNRLLNDEPLDGLSLPRSGGRLDLSDLALPGPKVVQQWQTPLANVTRIEPGGTFRHVKWRDLDFSGSRLNSLRFYESEVINCRFDRCQLRDLRLWATTIRDRSFNNADLRDSALGVATLEQGPLKGKRNIFAGVDFTEADMRGTVYVAAAFEHCIFRNAKLIKIGFGTSSFVDCQFEGELREVIFWRSDLFARGFPEDAFPPNEMLNIDFSLAKLRWVEFRGLTLEGVRLPKDREHVVIKDFASALDEMIGILGQQADETARVLVAIFQGARKWSPQNATGVLNTQDLTEAGEGAVERVLGLLHQSRFRVD
jgi:uncharacterized protein YjbI with pentapeptide repeats